MIASLRCASAMPHATSHQRLCEFGPRWVREAPIESARDASLSARVLDVRSRKPAIPHIVSPKLGMADCQRVWSVGRFREEVDGGNLSMTLSEAGERIKGADAWTLSRCAAPWLLAAALQTGV